MVRNFAPRFFRPPWPFIKKGDYGQRKIGPMTFEKHQWPGQNREFPELSPKFQKLNPEELHNYTKVAPTGYKDPATGKFVSVPEMIPELVVPDLSGFELKPYVSFRTDVEIEKREKEFEKLVEKKGSVEAADAVSSAADRWPPPKMNSKTLFELFYADKVRDAYIAREKESGAVTDSTRGTGKRFLNKMRLPFVVSKRSLHTTLAMARTMRGPLVFPGWYPRDHKAGPYPKTEEERRAAAMKYGIRPEDYKPIDVDNVQHFSGDYPDFGPLSFDHKDPYEDYSNSTYRRNWNEPVQKDWMTYRPDRETYTGLDAEQMKWTKILVAALQIFVPLCLMHLYLSRADVYSLRWKNPAMPKQFPYDLYRAWPHDDPCSYPITNYSFELKE